MMKKTTTLGATLADISAVIKTRRDGDVRESYTAQLLNDDGERLMKKIVEEAGEVVIAAALARRKRVVEEIADLWFHCLVLMEKHNISQDQLANNFAKRRGISGIAEKAARTGDMIIPARRQMTAEVAAAVVKLVESGHYKSLGEAAKHLGLSRSAVQKYRAAAGITNPKSVAAGKKAAKVNANKHTGKKMTNGTKEK